MSSLLVWRTSHTETESLRSLGEICLLVKQHKKISLKRSGSELLRIKTTSVLNSYFSSMFICMHADMKGANHLQISEFLKP